MANNLDALVPEIWSTNIIENINQINVAMNFANTDYEGEVRNAGDTVQVRTYGNITIGDYQRGQTLSIEDLVPVKEALTVDKSKYFGFSVDDLDVVQNDVNAINGYTRRAAVAMSNEIDRYLFGFYSSALAANQVSSVTITSNTATTAVFELIVDAGKLLDQQNVPQTDRWIVLSPYAKSVLMKSTTYLIRASAMGDQVVTTSRLGATAAQASSTGYVGQCAGFDVWCSNALPTSSGSAKYCLWGQGKPISYAAQIPPGRIEALRRESTFGTLVRGLLLHGGKVFAENSKALGYTIMT